MKNASLLLHVQQNPGDHRELHFHMYLSLETTDQGTNLLANHI